MLIRISLIVAILAGLAVGVLNFVTVKEKVVALTTSRDTERSQKEEAQRNLASTKKELGATKTELTQTKQTLDATSAERDRAVAEAAAKAKLATQLADDLGKAKLARDDALANLEAYRVTGYTPPQILALGKTLKQTQDTLTEAQILIGGLQKKITKLDYELAKYRGTNPIVYLPAEIKGKILVSDPKWDFVVLNVGEDQGILKDGELLVSRDGKLVAKVVVSSVQKERCIANLMPGWRIGQVFEGDQVIPAHPAS